MIKHSCSWYEPMQMYILKWNKMGTNLTWTLWIVRYKYTMCESHTPGDIQNKPLTNLYFLFFVNYIYSFCKIIFLSLNKPRFRTYNASKDVIGAFHNVLLMKTPVSLSNALLSKATRWQKLHSYWLAKATRCFLKQRVVATRNDPFGLPYTYVLFTNNVTGGHLSWLFR